AGLRTSDLRDLGSRIRPGGVSWVPSTATSGRAQSHVARHPPRPHRGRCAGRRTPLIEEHEMTSTQQVWLTQDGYERLKDELHRLLRERAGDVPADDRPSAQESTDEEVLVARREREQRIRRLQELL